MGCNSSKDNGYEGQDGIDVVSQDDAKRSAALRAEALRVADEMFLATKGRRFHENYARLTLTSYGASCKVLTAFHRFTNKKVAVKTIPKSRKQADRQRQKVKLEIGTFRLLEDHPNAVRVLEVYEGAECYYIVMECCEGGELFDHISKKQGFFTERQAAHLLRSLMLFVAHMHAKGIAHMDIKPENIMFDSEGATGVLKVLDFGSSMFVQPNELVHNAFGTVRYASPEMANDVCGQKADIWSAGIVMYILLCGKAPFLKANDLDTLNLIKSGPRVKFNGERWHTISQAAKDCIRALLEPNPRQRPTAAEVLTLPWLKQQVPETVILPDTLQHLRTFANQSRIRRLLLGLMADQLVGSSANQLLGQFYNLDKDFSGTLEVSELIKAAKESIPDLTEPEINRMFEALDVDRTGTVDVKEFFAGLIQTIDEEKQTLVAQKSFTMLDRRGAGFVTKEAFMEVLLERAQAGTLKTLAPKGASSSGMAAPASPPSELAHRGSGGGDPSENVMLDPGLVSELEQEFANLDANGDGVLSFEEFKAILGIQSTPEGLQLPQNAVTAAPSIAEGIETLAQTLRTVTRTSTVDEGGGALGGLCAPSHTSRGGRYSNGGTVLTPGPHSAGSGLTAAAGITGRSGPSRDVMPHRRSASGTVGVGGSGPLAGVERAALDLEQPLELEMRDLLQLLAPARRTPSVQGLRSHSHQLAGHPGATVSGAPAGFARMPSQREIRRDPAVAAVLARQPSHGSSMSSLAVIALDRSPSARVPPLPPSALHNAATNNGRPGSSGITPPSATNGGGSTARVMFASGLGSGNASPSPSPSPKNASPLPNQVLSQPQSQGSGRYPSGNGLAGGHGAGNGASSGASSSRSGAVADVSAVAPLLGGMAASSDGDGPRSGERGSGRGGPSPRAAPLAVAAGH
ncbi:hypothetical protein HYH03_003700 [Edaphochlamys debaryana]|uniref:Calcium-dependent protein kinase n=1 Tax=Edaphochlamys debaryana TaxID=47281 RepID=A0A835YBY0_9CHLO|nr:hypothetical protein HYH03_003700 [Edaphochlamys debaryana]|eukprot:KAG2498443.1 hypothetical protein HYH03_003700 [Edaphochlamys debaryana]